MKNSKDNTLTQLRKEYDISFIMNKFNEIKDSDANYVLIHTNIKNFRYYNTKYGKKAGNEILELVLKFTLNFIDEKEYVGYLYSDNYVMLLRYEQLDNFLEKRFIEFIDQSYRIDDERIYRNIFLSFGVYKIEDKNVEFNDALNLANLCRKECNSLDKRCYSYEVYDQSYYNQYMDRMELEIKTADAYKNYEFVPFLQPKVDLKTEKIIGAEALLRWFDNDGKSIPLYKFLPILNQNIYIELVDLDIFDQICKYLDERIKNNKKVVPVSFNISKAYFYSPKIISDYIKVFEKYNVPKRYIEIEFMESISLDDTERMKKIVGGFKDYGFTCALDDFGNGYSSFNVLLNAPFDIIKMDRQFFLDNLKGDNKLIIHTVVNLIHSLKMKVVAEGVESKEHISYLKECGCDYVQGYYYYKPMPVDEVCALLDKE